MSKSILSNKTNLTIEELNKMVEENDDLYLDDLEEIPEGWCPNVRGDLFLNGLAEIPEGWSPIIGWSLFLNGLTEIPKKWNPIVGENLHLRSVSTLSKDFPKDFAPSIGGVIFTKYCSPSGIKSPNQLQDGTYVPGKYLYVNKKLTHIKGCCQDSDYTFYEGKFKGCNVITDGKYFAYCDSFREGISYLIFKRIADCDTSHFADYFNV